MIDGAHTIIYSSDAEATRKFFRDVLGFASVDAGQGWLIFALPPGELAAHPSEGDEGQPGRAELYLMCDDLKKTMEDLKKKGVEFTSPANDRGWGILTTLKVPGAGQIGLYQPRHPRPKQR
jgi:catechol 2,3-dioxygenase-like lactoylglutathione lyase family enzyme